MHLFSWSNWHVFYNLNHKIQGSSVFRNPVFINIYHSILTAWWSGSRVRWLGKSMSMPGRACPSGRIRGRCCSMLDWDTRNKVRVHHCALHCGVSWYNVVRALQTPDMMITLPTSWGRVRRQHSYSGHSLTHTRLLLPHLILAFLITKITLRNGGCLN